MFRPLELVLNAIATQNGRRNVLYRWRRWRLRVFTAYGSGQAVVYRLRGRRKFVAHPGDLLSQRIAEERSYEPLESRVVAKILRAGDSTIDIGANIGYYTALCAECIGEEGRVLAFEPGKATLSKLQTTLALLRLKNVEAHAVALAEESGIRDFVASSSGKDAQQSLVEWSYLVGDRETIKVETATLDEVVFSLNLRGLSPAFVKCDVEGAEAKVLRGSGKLLESDSPPVFMVEVNRSALAAQKSKVSDVLKGFDGYCLYFTPLDSNEKRFRPLTNVSDLPEFANVLAFPTRGIYGDRIAMAAKYLPEGNSGHQSRFSSGDNHSDLSADCSHGHSVHHARLETGEESQ